MDNYIFKPIIGIISWLPKDEPRCTARKEALNALCGQLSEIFPEVPIVIIAQAWEAWRPAQLPSATTIIEHNAPLTIIGARNTLRDWFLASDYNYIITFDDDCELIGTKECGDEYLQLLAAHPSGWTNFSNMFKLAAFSRDIYEQYPLPPLTVEDMSGIEDMAYFILMQEFESNKRIKCTHLRLREKAVYNSDASRSTWHHTNLNVLVQNTITYINKQKERQNKILS